MPSKPLEGDTDLKSSPLLAGLRNLPALTEKFLQVEKVREFYRLTQLNRPAVRPASRRPRGSAGIASGTPLVEAADRARIPVRGACMVVVNHAFGKFDRSLLAAVLKSVRSDVKVWTRVPQSAQAEAVALEWLRKGGMLAIFPFADADWRLPGLSNSSHSPWNYLPVRLIRETGASVLPVYICGNAALNVFRNLRSRQKNPSPLHKLLHRHQLIVEVRIGGEIPADSVNSIAEEQQACEYLRWRTYLLKRRGRTTKSWPMRMQSTVAAKIQQPLAAAEPPASLAAELEALPPDRLVVESGALTAYLAKAAEIPCMLREIGRLREVTFRTAGEGTGKNCDLDPFDRYYWHILLWNKERRELVGAYRAGNTREILSERGVKGLYTSTLFRYGPEVFEKLGPALELGRSFVRPEYQRQYAPLLLLWKAIARVLARQPEIAVVFGPVSISNDYSKASREMIYRFFEARVRQDALASELTSMIVPRKPFRPSGLRPWDCRAMCRALRDLDELSQPITDVETDGKGLPVLLRQYAKIGGKMLGFNVDRKFSNVLDGLVVVDLRKTEHAVLERYMGRTAAESFRQKHGLQAQD